MIGSHRVKVWCKKQLVVALSSAESEIYAGLKTGTESLGLQSLGREFGESMGVELILDSSAALSLANRQGLGRAKHIEMQHLWLQDAVKRKRLTTKKVDSAMNPADLMTKALNREAIDRLMGAMGYKFA